MSETILIQAPPASTRLILLFHGVGSTPESMVPLGRRLAETLPNATIISVRSPDSCDMGSGYQWFSVRGITEDNRVQRVADAMPRFVSTVRKLQATHGIAAEDTVLVGFSQGAIMALESSGLEEVLAGCIVSIAGRFPRPPQRARTLTAFHLIHGDSDLVITPGYGMAAASQLRELGANVSLDLMPQLGHGINQAAAERVVHCLQPTAT
uniref:Putative hydrolase n=1 Tax=Sym plasmid TaxID=28430 RepID=A0A515HIR4_9ZZZZ|nr:putative hydrolase [Sym plasmid]